MSKIPSDNYSDAFCDVENGSIQYPNTLLHGIPQEFRKSSASQKPTSDQKLMTPSVSIYLTTHTLLKMPSIHTSFLGIHLPKDYARGKGNECLPSALSTYMFDMFCCCCCLSVGHRSLLTLFPLLLALYLFLANFSWDVCEC